MRIPQIFIKVSDWFNNESVTNNWLSAVGDGVSTYVNSPSVSVVQNTRQSIPGTGNSVPIIFDYVKFDLDPRGSYDPATGKFTPRVAGYYQFSATVSLTSISAIELWQNGIVALGGTVGTTMGGIPSGTIASTIYLNGQGDYIEIRAAQTSGTAQLTTAAYNYAGIPTGNATHFGISLIRPA